MAIEKYLAQFVSQQFPEFYQDEGPVFIDFVQAYYEWLEADGNIINKSRSLLDYRDIDTTLPEYVAYFNDKYLFGIPNTIQADKRLLIKHILDVYRAKGTVQGYKLLFRLLYNQDISVYFPGDDLLKPSDGDWLEAKYLEVNDHPLNKTFPGLVIKGSSSQATAVVEYFIQRAVNNKIVNLLFLSNVNGTFIRGEKISKSSDYATIATLDTPKILGSATSVSILGGGQQFSIGDLLAVTNGSGVEALCRVTSLTTGAGSIAISIINGGNLFSLSAETIYTRTSANGSNLAFSVGGLSNIQNFNYNTDFIYPYANTLLTQGNVQSIAVTSGGTGYTNASVVTITPNYYISSMTITNPGGSYSNGDTVVFGGPGTGATGNVYTNASGNVMAIDITNPGSGYSTATVSITSGTGSAFAATVTTANTGSGAVASCVTGAANTTIVSFNVSNKGQNYLVPPTVTVATGSGGVFVANVNTDWGMTGNSTTSYLRSNLSVLHFTSGTFGTIASLANVNIGINYDSPPIFKVRDLVHLANITGTVAFSNSSANVTGTGTSFTYWFQSNTVIRLWANTTTSELRFISSVANDTFLTLDTTPLYTNASAQANPSVYLMTSIFSPDQLLQINSTYGGFNETITGAPNFGAGVVANVAMKASGVGYQDGEQITMYKYGAIANVSVVTGGRSYSNGDLLAFAGGGTSYPASGAVLTNANGTITSVAFSYRGAGYQTSPVVSVISKTGSNASLTATIGGLDTTYTVTGTINLGGMGTALGKWTSTKSFLDSDKYIQDSYYYQEYSYEIQSSFPLSSYGNIVKTVYHPAGTELFGKVVVSDYVGTNSSIVANTETIVIT